MKHIAVFILSWAYLVVLLLGGSNLARRYHFQQRHDRLYATCKCNNETIYAILHATGSKLSGVFYINISNYSTVFRPISTMLRIALQN
jgi:hypothetical protein